MDDGSRYKWWSFLSMQEMYVTDVLISLTTMLSISTRSGLSESEINFLKEVLPNSFLHLLVSFDITSCNSFMCIVITDWDLFKHAYCHGGTCSPL
ncbi:hypothetical protein RJ641_026565 [Dillenia turbinata]|uniref:Uncharacterized protein n=1 Tax=Dillenia turbinata TaxID=194707 RepID=A0AAN8W759_9MAGN